MEFLGVTKVKSKTSVLSNISYVMIIMIFSRLLSLVSNSVYTSFFGAQDLYLNIYSYAIAIPNTIFNCFGTALSTVVIPIYASLLAKGENTRAKKFADNIITLASAFTLVLVVIGMALSFVIPKFTKFSDGAAYSFATKALMIMMPVMLFYALNYIFQGMLQSKGKFGWPAFVSVPSSLVVILYVFTLGDRFGVTGLLIATFIGLSLQAIILIPPLYTSGYRYSPIFDLKSEDIKQAFSMTLPVLVGVSAYQINMFYNTTMIARFDGMTTLLTTVQNLVVYMVLAFVYSVTAVIYPRLTELCALSKMDEFKSELCDILTNVWTLLVPITFGFIAVRRPLLSLVLEWGKTGEDSIDAAAMLCFMYCIGIIGVGSKEILDRAFYALKDTKTPAVNGFIIMGVNIVSSLVLIRFIGAYGIPLAYSIASLSGLCVLLYLLRRKIGTFAKGAGAEFVKCTLSGAVMFAAVTIIKNVLSKHIFVNVVLDRIFDLFVPVAVGILIYAVMICVLRVKAARKFLSKFGPFKCEVEK